MNRFKLSMLLRKQNGLALRRSPVYEQNLVAKIMILFGSGVMIIYMMFLGTMMAIMASESAEYGVLLALMPLWMAIDFGVRFMFQQPPSVMVKPYLLQPIPMSSVIETYVCNMFVASYNFIWLGMFLPYCFVVGCGGATIWQCLLILLSGMLLVMANSQFYMIVRTLTGRSIFWWLLPIAVYGCIWITMPIDMSLFDKQMDYLAKISSTGWFTLISLALLLVVFFLNRRLQLRYVRDEVMQQEKKEAAVKHVSKFTFLSQFGQTGEYLKLELKSIMRNKAIRQRVMMSLVLIVCLTLLVSYTSVYDSPMMLNFWCYYCFGIYGMTTLIKIMGPEGNYIDLLMTHRENILSLLYAKYYIHVAILLIPLLLMIPAVIMGKYTILMMTAYLFICSGMLYFTYFQLAVYNKQTLPLNQKLTGKGNMENGIQMAIQMIAIIAPLAIAALFVILFGETVAHLILTVIGLLFTVTHPLWLRNVYKRMMKRKYQNLEGFHATRL